MSTDDFFVTWPAALELVGADKEQTMLDLVWRGRLELLTRTPVGPRPIRKDWGYIAQAEALALNNPEARQDLLVERAVLLALFLPVSAQVGKERKTKARTVAVTPKVKQWACEWVASLAKRPTREEFVAGVRAEFSNLSVKEVERLKQDIAPGGKGGRPPKPKT